MDAESPTLAPRDSVAPATGPASLAASLVGLPGLQGYTVDAVVQGESIGQVWAGSGACSVRAAACRCTLMRGAAVRITPALPPSPPPPPQVLSRANHDAGDMLSVVDGATAAAVAAGTMRADVADRLLAAYSARMHGYTWVSRQPGGVGRGLEGRGCVHARAGLRAGSAVGARVHGRPPPRATSQLPLLCPSLPLCPCSYMI
jgi:hypothetical protein